MKQPKCVYLLQIQEFDIKNQVSLDAQVLGVYTTPMTSDDCWAIHPELKDELLRYGLTEQEIGKLDDVRDSGVEWTTTATSGDIAVSLSMLEFTLNTKAKGSLA